VFIGGGDVANVAFDVDCAIDDGNAGVVVIADVVDDIGASFGDDVAAANVVNHRYALQFSCVPFL
jgi:hypothetical protein